VAWRRNDVGVQFESRGDRISRLGDDARDPRREHAGRPNLRLWQEQAKAGWTEPSDPIRLAGLGSDGVHDLARDLLRDRPVVFGPGLEQQDRSDSAVSDPADPFLLKRGRPVGAGLELEGTSITRVASTSASPSEGRLAFGRRGETLDERLDVVIGALTRHFVVMMVGQDELRAATAGFGWDGIVVRISHGTSV